MVISFGFPAYYPVEYDPEQNDVMRNQSYRDNMGRLLFTDNQTIVHIYGTIQNMVLNQFIIQNGG